jgi:hypothetical protein
VGAKACDIFLDGLINLDVIKGILVLDDKQGQRWAYTEELYSLK